MLAGYCESFRILVIALLSMSIEEHVLTIPKSILIHTKIATPLPCLLGLLLGVII